MRSIIAGVVALAAASAVTPVAAQEAGEQVGRYTIVVKPDADAFLLDTMHGLVWRQVKFGDVHVWQFMFRLDNMQNTDNFLKNVLPNITNALPTTKTPSPQQ
jgi:hypothetical protein